MLRGQYFLIDESHIVISEKGGEESDIKVHTSTKSALPHIISKIQTEQRTVRH